MRHLDKLWRRKRKPAEKRSPLTPFGVALNEKTNAPLVVPYLFFGYGILPHFRAQTERIPDSAGRIGEKHPIHYFRLRPWMGRQDPCIVRGGLQESECIASKLIASEPRKIEAELWRTLFRLPPTHVVRFGWSSQVTGGKYDVLYIPLNFAFSGFDAKKLAIAWGDYFLEILQQNNLDLMDICPSNRRLARAQAYWMIMTFFRLRWKVIEEPLEKYRRR